jgi:hypothetical protein
MKAALFLALFASLSAYAQGPLQSVFLEGKFEDGKTCRISYKLQEENEKQIFSIADFDIFNDRGIEKYNTGLLNLVTQVKKLNLSSKGFIGSAEWKENGKHYEIRIRFSGRDISDPGTIRAEVREGSLLFGSKNERACNDLKTVSREEFYRARVQGMAKDQIQESKERCEQAAYTRTYDYAQINSLSQIEAEKHVAPFLKRCEEISERRLKNLPKTEINAYETLPTSSVDFAESKMFKDLDSAQAAESHNESDAEKSSAVLQ